MYALPDKWNPRVWLRDWLLASTQEEEQAARVLRNTKAAEWRARKIIEHADGGAWLAENDAQWGLTPSQEVLRLTEELVQQARDAGVSRR